MGRKLAVLAVLVLAGCSTQNTATNVTTHTAVEPQSQSSEPPPEYQTPTVSATTGDGQNIDAIGVAIVEQWWFPDSASDYRALADSLENDELITTELATSWRTQGERPLTNLTETVRVTSMETARLEADNASFEIVYEQRANEGEPQRTFIEFVLDDDQWKANQIR